MSTLDPAELLAEEAKKPPCRNLQITGKCEFGANCRFSHVFQHFPALPIANCMQITHFIYLLLTFVSGEWYCRYASSTRSKLKISSWYVNYRITCGCLTNISTGLTLSATNLPPSMIPPPKGKLIFMWYMVLTCNRRL